MGPGDIIDEKYELKHLIGEGGMSTVYLAARADDQYRKRVAIKLVPLAMASAEHLRRFRGGQGDQGAGQQSPCFQSIAK